MAQLTRKAFLAAMGLAALSGCSGTGDDTDAETGTDVVEEDQATEEETATQADTGTITSPIENGYESGTHHATIEVQDRGTITVELNADQAPITVSNFAELANSGFYDGLTFHRIIQGFMMQGGDPNGDGTGGSERNIKGEFVSNGVSNMLVHTRGTISMARSTDYDSGSSQFFIMQETTSSLDGSYAAFGHVTDGMDVVDDICDNAVVEDDNGTVASENQPVISAITMVD